MIQELQDAEAELLEFEPELRRTRPSSVWKDHETDTTVSDTPAKGMTEKRRLLLFGGAVIGVSVIVYGISKFIHYIEWLNTKDPR